MRVRPQFFLILYFFLLPFSISAQNNIHQFSSKENNILRNIINDNNSFYIGGSFEDSASFNGYTLRSLAPSLNTKSGKSGDIFIAKLDTGSNVQWASIIGGNNYTSLNYLAKDKSGNLALTLDFQGFFVIEKDTISGLNGRNCGIVKLNPNGEKIWTKAITSNKRIEQRYLTTDEDNNIYITANCSDTIYIDGKAYFANFISSIFIKLDAQGNLKWIKIFSNNEKGEFIVATSVSVLPSGEIILVGNSSKKSGNFEGKQLLADDTVFRFFVMKIKEDNTILWINTATGTSGAAAGRYMDISENGDIYITGIFYGSMKIENTLIHGLDKPPYSDLFLSKYNNEGKLAWIKVIGSNTGNADLVNGIKYRPNGKLYLCASYLNNYQIDDTILTPTGKADGILAEFDTSAKLTRLITTKGKDALCISTFQDFDFDKFGNLNVIGSFNFIVNLNNVQLSTSGATDAFLWKINDWNTSNNLPENQSNIFDFNFNIFPNPGSEYVNINFTIDKPERIKFELIDLAGRTLFFKRQTTYSLGTHQEKFELKNLKPGIYFIKAISNKGILSKKLIIQEN